MTGIKYLILINLTQKCFRVIKINIKVNMISLIAWVFPYYGSTAELISEISAVQFFNLKRVKKVIRP